jgi:hypothetical protein
MRFQDLFEAAEMCVHFRGEEPTSPERTEEINRGTDEECGKAKKLLRVARKSGLDASRDAVLSVVLDRETPERCRLVPTRADFSSIVLEEALAACAHFRDGGSR